MTATQVYELTTQGGARDFARLIRSCEAFGPYCLIGGLAANYYVEPVYTLDADLVRHLIPPHAQPSSRPRIQFTTDERYQTFPERSVTAEVFGVAVKIACLEDLTQGKLRGYGDPKRRFSKRKKDELDLVRLAESCPRLKSRYPLELQNQIERG